MHKEPIQGTKRLCNKLAQLLLVRIDFFTGVIHINNIFDCRAPSMALLMVHVVVITLDWYCGRTWVQTPLSVNFLSRIYSVLIYV